MRQKVTSNKSAPIAKKTIPKQYSSWIAELKKRYRATQIKAAVAVNSALIEFYWNLGKDISERYPGKVRDAGFYQKLSADLKLAIPNATGLSVSNIKYARYFYELYAGVAYRQQVADDNLERTCRPQVLDDNKGRSYRQQLVDDKSGLFIEQLISLPWGHHMLIIDKCRNDRQKALFYVKRTIQNGWSRNVLLNWLSSDLYAREGNAQTNFALTMPSGECELAQQLVKDPQVFELLGLADAEAQVSRKK